MFDLLISRSQIRSRTGIVLALLIGVIVLLALSNPFIAMLVAALSLIAGFYTAMIAEFNMWDHPRESTWLVGIALIALIAGMVTIVCSIISL